MFRAGTPPVLFGAYSPAPLNDVAVPPFPGYEADEGEDSQAEGRDLDVEFPQHAWRPLPPAAPPPDIPLRFVDGSIFSRTAGMITVGYRRRPLVAAVIAAGCLQLHGKELRRGAGACVQKLLCVNSNGIEADDLKRARDLLAAVGISLRVSEAEETGDFDAMRRSARAIAMEAMEDVEKQVMLADLTLPTLVDGLLERRLKGERQDAALVGLVKRQVVSYLPAGLQELAYSLSPGERTPAFVLRTQDMDLVNVYMRLAAPAGASPSYGIVRVTVPLAYVQKAHRPDLGAYLSGLAGYLYALRQRDYAYARAGISVAPIVRLEEQLHAIIPSIDVLVQKLNRLLLEPAEAR